MRYERSVTIYADAPIIKRFQANETSISIAQGKISALISESEWIELQNSSKTMYSQLASAVLELDALTLNFSDMTAKYNGLSDQFTDLDSKVAEYKIGIDGISSNLTSVQQSLQNDYSTTIETNAAIKASIDELSSLISKDYVTNSEFGSLTIGSVNMLRNSDFAQQSRYWTAQGITVQYGSDTTVGTYARISSTAAGSTDHRLYQTTESFSHESNVEYTLSFWAKASVNTDIKAGHINQLSTFGIGTDWKRYNATYKVGSTGSFTVYPISSNVTLYITKIKIEKGSKLTDWTPAPADINELIGIEGDSAVSESNKYTNNKLTAYSTTSQVNSAINQKADEITTSVSATYATKASVTDVKEEAINSANSNTANLLKSYSTTAQMNSAISQKANEITTSVSETYATKTSVTTAKNEAITAAQGYADDAEEAANSHTDNLLKSYSTTTQMNSAISQKADEITATVAKTYMTQADFNNMKLGGRNLIRNSTGLLGTLNWENRFLDYSLLTKDGDALLRKSGQLLIFKRNISGSAATISAVTNNSYPTQQHSAFSLGNTTTGEKYVYSARFSLKASTTYTMSGYVYVSAGAKGIDILVLGDYSITDLNSQYVTYDKAYSILTYTTTGQWYYFTKTFTTDASTKSGIVRVDHNGVSSSGSTAKILFGNLKLEESNGKTTDWTPAPEDNADNAAAYTDAKLQNYSTTQQVNSMISQKADEITLSVSENYATKASVTTAEQNAVNAANANTRDLLTNYSTTTQMNSAINQKADEISTSVSTTYATKTSVTTAQNNAINTAKNYTDSANADTLETAQNYTDTAKTDTLKTAQDYANTAKSDAMKAAQGYADNAEAAANANTANLLKSYSTTTQMNSAINQKADEISTSVSETYLTQATFNEMKLGTRNLIRNSTGLLGVQGWTNNFKDYTLVTKQNKTLLRKGGQALLFKKNTASSLATLAATGNAGYPTFQQTALQLSNSTTGEKYIYSSRFALKPSTTYTMSGYVYVSSGAKGVDVFVLASNSITDLSSQYVTYDNAYSILTCTTTNQWYYFKKTFTTGASVKSGIVRIDHNGVNTAGTFAPIRYGNLKLEESNDKVTDWTPAPEDDTDYTDGKLKAYSTTVEMQSAINQKANEISMTVSQTYTTVKEFDDYKNTADVQYTTISSKYTQLADKFTWVVSGGTSSSNFTITSRLAELVANDINLHGRVTFSGLDSSAQGKINTAQSTANSAQSTANSVQSTVNSNKSAWDSASSWTSSNGSNMTNLRNMVLKWTDNAVSTTTQINGGWIKTNTITADKIALGDFTNYATDGSFELGVYSDSGYFSIVTSQKLTGTKSLKMGAGVSGYKAFDLNKYKNFAVYSGEKIYVSWWGRRENANQPAGINIQIVDQNGNNLHYDISGTTQMPETAANNTWIKYSYVATVQSTGYALVQFKKRADGTLSGNWYVDEVVVRRMASGELIVSGSITADKLSVTSLESISARIGGWTISGNNLMDDKTNFMVRIAAPTEYGGDGNGNADVLVVKDKTNGTFPLVISSNGQVLATRCKFEGGTIGGWTISPEEIYCDAGSNSCGISKYGTSLAFWAGETVANRNNAIFRVWHDGSMEIKGFMRYSKQGWDTPDGKVHTSIGGWQIKTGSWDGYPTAIYWDTDDSQKNGIAADGPWVVWGGWNGGPSVNTDNYKFVVTAEGVCKAMSWVTGSRLEWKENIEQYNHSALAEVMKSDVYYYDLKNASKTWKQNRHIGFVIGDGYSVSEEILNGDKGAIDMYNALAIAYKAIQEQQQEIEMLKNKLQQS